MQTLNATENKFDCVNKLQDMQHYRQIKAQISLNHILRSIYYPENPGYVPGKLEYLFKTIDLFGIFMQD